MHRLLQESTGFSSKNTVHSPQLAVSHPRLTLLQPKERTRSISRDVYKRQPLGMRCAPWNQKIFCGPTA